MATARTAGVKIAARARRIGWPVETGNGRQAWLYRITMPNGERVQIHSSPSDVNWEAHVLQQLEAGGFSAAEKAWLEQEEEKRQQRLAADREKAERAAEKAAARSAALQKAAGPLVPQTADLKWMTTPTPFPETRQVIVTPQIAETLLDTINTGNRKLRERKVEVLVESIRSGDWALTHQGGATDSSGVLQDGQHRLAAIMESGVECPMMWTVGMPPENYHKVDTGLLRGGADVVHARGNSKYETATAAAARMIYLYTLYGPEVRTAWRSHPVTNAIMARALDEYGEPLVNAVFDAAKVRTDLKAMNHPAAAAFIFLVRSKLPEGDPRIDQFLKDVTTGANLSEKDPVFALRRQFIRTRAAGQRIEAYQALGLLLKTWKLRNIGQSSGLMRFDKDEKMPLVFLPPPIEADEDMLFPEPNSQLAA